MMPRASSCPAASCVAQSLDEFRSTLKLRWDVRVGLQEQEKEEAKAAKQREIDSRKEVCVGVCLSLFVCLCFFSDAQRCILGQSRVRRQGTAVGFGRVFSRADL